jgi:sugar phosphate isomerase/epimerase
MKLGIKVNADTDSFDRLAGSNPTLAEVWFNANGPEKYTELFDELKRRKCDVGLHFWGMLDNNIAPNIAHPDDDAVQQTLRLMRKTIDIAAQNNFQYVNIHPGSAALLQVNYQKERYDMIREPVDMERSIELFLENAQSLNEYAKTRGIVFTVETVPPRITDGWYDEKARLTPKNVYELPPVAIVRAAELSLSIANDFCHTAANVITDDPDVVWTYLFGLTKQLAPSTRLIHIGFVMPPYNGTDNHDHLDNPMMRTHEAVPNNEQLVELLKLFKDRDDVWVLTEPKDDHVKNYFLAKNLLDQAA